LHGAKGIRHFLCVTCRVDLVKARRDAAVRPDDEGAAAGKFHQPKIQQAVVVRSRAPIRIGQQRKRQLVFAGKLGVRTAVIQADAQHRRAKIAQHPDVIAKAARLLRAARRVVLGVEIQHQPASGVITQAMRFSVLIGQGKIRCHAAFHTLRARSQHPQHRACQHQQCSQYAQYQFGHVFSRDAPI